MHEQLHNNFHKANRTNYDWLTIELLLERVNLPTKLAQTEVSSSDLFPCPRPRQSIPEPNGACTYSCSVLRYLIVNYLYDSDDGVLSPILLQIGFAHLCVAASSDDVVCRQRALQVESADYEADRPGEPPRYVLFDPGRLVQDW